MATLQDKKLFLFDIDGTIAIGSELIDGTRQLLSHIEKIGGKAIYITNNSTKGIADYIEKFRAWDLATDESNFVTAATATIRYLKAHYADKRIFALGTRSFVRDLRASGLTVTEAVEPDISCAVVGFDSELSYEKADRFCELMFSQDPDFIATNPDLRCPTPYGMSPDCGAICRMLSATVDKEPIYIGKPNPEIVSLCLAQTGFTKEETLVVGDRLYTDIACGLNAGVDTAVVFTGEAKPQDLIDTPYPPTYRFETVLELFEAVRGLR